MMRVIFELLRNPGRFFQEQRGQRVLLLGLLSVLPVCLFQVMAWSTARRRSPSEQPAATAMAAAIRETNTKWWVRKAPSQTPAGILNQHTTISTPAAAATSDQCPAYAADFLPGTYGYVSLFPPYESLIRSGAGKSYSIVGSIERGGWLKVLDLPICSSDGYVWLNVQSAGSAGSWTAGGYLNAQWVIPCPDPNEKCDKKEQPWLPTLAPGAQDKDHQAYRCVSDKLTVGLDAQISPTDLLVIRAEPYTGIVLGRLPPAAAVTIIEGPKCAGGIIWWKVTSGQLAGWAVESLLKPCPKEGECEPWK